MTKALHTLVIAGFVFVVLALMMIVYASRSSHLGARLIDACKTCSGRTCGACENGKMWCSDKGCNAGGTACIDLPRFQMACRSSVSAECVRVCTGRSCTSCKNGKMWCDIKGCVLAPGSVSGEMCDIVRREEVSCSVPVPTSSNSSIPAVRAPTYTCPQPSTCQNNFGGYCPAGYSPGTCPKDHVCCKPIPKCEGSCTIAALCRPPRHVIVGKCDFQGFACCRP